MKTFLISLLIVLNVSGFAQNKQALAKSYVQNLFTGNYPAAIALQDESLKAQLSEPVLKMVNDQLINTFGDYQKVLSTRDITEDHHASVLVETAFARIIATLKIPFNENNKITGIFVASTKSTPEEENRPQTPKPPFPYQSEDVSFINSLEGNTLAGTLTLPGMNKTHPVYVMITGSGAQNRDEEIFGHKPFLVIADYLARNGIATLRMDDRGVGESSPGKPTDTTADFATDIEAAVKFLKKRGYKNIGLIGHSEGGLIAEMVASEDRDVKNIILLAAPGQNGNDLLTLQNEKIEQAENVPAKEIAADVKIKKEFFDFVRNYHGNNFKSDATTYFNKFFQENSNLIPMEQQQPLAEALINAMTPWMQYFLKTTPPRYLVKIKIPVLALDGSLDTQVPAKENLAAISEGLTKARNKDFKIVEISGLNHLFQSAKTGAPSEYATIEETFSPRALEIIKDWILKQNPKMK